MFVIYYAPRHYDILIKLLKASTMRFKATSLTRIFVILLPWVLEMCLVWQNKLQWEPSLKL